MQIETLDTPSSILGEGLFIDEISGYLYWVDILGNKIYQFSINSKKLENSFDIPSSPSSILDLKNNRLTYTNKLGVAQLNLTNGRIEQLIDISHDTQLFRSNDGVKLKDGSFVFGTMAYQPDKKFGIIYKTNKGNSIDEFELGIHIPNTFIELEDEILISDSYKKITYSYPKDLNNKPKIWADFSKELFTPDGGVLTEDGRIFIAMWGGAKIIELSIDGKFVQNINLPVLQPTNCVFSSDNCLYVTSAKEGLTENQLAEYPLSGKTIKIHLGSSSGN